MLIVMLIVIIYKYIPQNLNTIIMQVKVDSELGRCQKIVHLELK